MRYLVDPASVRLELVGLTFAAILCVALPWLAYKQHQGLKAATVPVPTRAQIYGSALVTHALIVLLTAAAMWRASLSLFPPVSIGAFEIAVGAASLAIGLPFLSERFKGLLDPLAEERTRMMAPRTGRELAAFYVMSASAGFSEQLAYRGALFAILSAVTGHWWVAAAISAAAFGMAHLFQGGRAVAFVTLIGLRDQIVVGLTGTLVVAMIAHAVHDMVAGTVLGMRARRGDGGNAIAIP